MLAKETIIKFLKEDDRAVARALLVLNERQTSDEQATEHTRYQNGMGFRPCHARMGTSMAKFFLQSGYLSPKQIAYWRAYDKTGSMRIGIYWKQLAEAAEMKATSKKAAVVDNRRDLGNDMERKLLLEYELGMVMDSDDPSLIDPITAQIAEIDAYWNKIQRANDKI
jgi:hypothetical protein